MLLMMQSSGVAKMCSEDGLRWKLCHGGTHGGLQGRVQQLIND